MLRAERLVFRAADVMFRAVNPVFRAVDGVVEAKNLMSLPASLILGSPCLVAE
jgi:hypothetical protein